MRKISVSVVLLLLLTVIIGLNSCQSKPKVKEGDLVGDISISGAFALYPMVVKWADEFKQLHPAVKIDISAGGAGKGMTDVLAKVVDLGMVSREVYAPEFEKGAMPFAVAKDAVIPTMNPNNPLASEILKRGLTLDAAKKLWITGENSSWGDVLGNDNDTPIHVYTRSDACGAAETWALWMGYKQEDLLGTAVFGDPGLAQAVQKDALSIGLNNIGYAYDEATRGQIAGLCVLPLDVNGNGVVDPEESFYSTKDELIQAIAEDKYPSPPARDLYLVSNGTPTNPVLVAFLQYILTEGQQYNVPSGYIALSPEKLQKGLDMLNTEK